MQDNRSQVWRFGVFAGRRAQCRAAEFPSASAINPFGYSIEFHRFSDRHISPVLTLEKQPARLQPSLSATPDGKTVYYTQYDREGVIKIM